MATRKQNENQFGFWTDLENGGRIYEKVVPGKHGWSAVYYKEVDSEENTIRFWQEIRDQNGQLREIHEKYPIDTGHRKL
jgi:hypothetical protein